MRKSCYDSKISTSNQNHVGFNVKMKNSIKFTFLSLSSCCDLVIWMGVCVCVWHPCSMKCQFRQLSGKCHHIISIYGLHTGKIKCWCESACHEESNIIINAFCKTFKKLLIWFLCLGTMRFFVVVVHGATQLIFYLCIFHVSPNSFRNVHVWKHFMPEGLFSLVSNRAFHRFGLTEVWVRLSNGL